MQITNYNKIPLPIYRAISHNWYSGADAEHFCSVTDLIKPEKLFVLEKRHQDELKREASDLIWSLMGSAMHKVLEKSESDCSLNEERLFAKVNGKIISGGIDLFEDGVISDFKFTSVWSYIFASNKKEWEKQLNCYSYLYEQAGFEVKKLQIIAIFRDWSARKAKFEANYPKQVEIIPIRKWSVDHCENFIKERLFKMAMALRLHDDVIKECGQHERWQDDDVYAIMKHGNKRAVKLCTSQEQAESFMSTNTDRDKLYLEVRHGEPKRCENYCPVNNYCHFYQQLHPEMFRQAI
ncbi:MAG: hypothetical protein K9M95_11780 [Candidatus Cloacimonetes bacterium]|nr:hypothetical protein [Candidatus Cloacimonadota bacterium]MCF7884808.1 hypothetical protein [Candidatus Cloacimonadota bacterium]